MPKRIKINPQRYHPDIGKVYKFSSVRLCGWMDLTAIPEDYIRTAKSGSKIVRFEVIHLNFLKDGQWLVRLRIPYDKEEKPLTRGELENKIKF